MTAVRAAGKGESWFSPAVAAQMAAWARGETPATSIAAGLTTQEREVLRLIAAGKTNREISVVLCISEKTVEKHVGELLAKLKVASRVEAAVLAVRAGLV